MSGSVENDRWSDTAAITAAESSTKESQLAQAVEAYLAELERGPQPDRAKFVARFPEIATELGKCLEGLELVHRVGPQLSSGGRSPRRAGGDPVMPEAMLGDYRILREIGRGGMGVVYEAEQISLPRRVALKVLPFAAVLDPRQLERFKNEARAAATLDHPGIVSVYSVGCERGVHFFAMQYIEGQSLAEVITELQGDRGAGQRDTDEEASELSYLTRGFVTARGEAASPPAAKETLQCTADGTAPTKAAAPTSSQTPLGSSESTRTSAFFQNVARLGVQAAEALDHAHARGIVHRDVKPGNLLLDAQSNVHVADFGLARIEQDAGMTMTGDILGTLRYMSPEQALAKRVVVDHRTDVYSLGVTLYELLTLQPAFGASDRRELLKQIAFEEPKTPSRLNTAIPSELEIIVLKAITKNPNDRYATALDLAGDLRCFLENKPIKARRVSRAERLWRWSKRNPIVSGLTAAVALLATLVAVVAVAGYAKTSVALAQVSSERDAAQTARLEEKAARLEIQKERDATFKSLYIAQMRLAQKDWDDGQINRLLKTLLSYLPEAGKPDLRGWEWYYHLSRCFGDWKTLRGHENMVRSMAWSRDGTTLASAGSGETKVWNPETGDLLETIPRRAVPGGLFAWNPNNRRLAFENSKHHIEVQHEQARFTIKDTSFGNQETVAWSPDGARLASIAPDKTVMIWDAATGEEIRKLVGHDTEVIRVAWSPDGRRLAASGFEPGTITIWDVETGARSRALESGQFNFCIVWSPDSARLAAGTFYGNAFVWDVSSGEKVLALSEKAPVTTMAWSPDGAQIATGIRGNTVTLWNANSGKLLRKLQGHTGLISAVVWSPDGKLIASGDRSGIVKIWDAVHDPVTLTVAEDAESVGISFSPDDQQLAYWATGRRIRICDAATGKEIHSVAGPAGDGLLPVWSPDGKHLACGGDDGSIVLYDAQKGEEVRSWMHEGVKAPVSTDPDRSVAVSWHPDGRQLASVSEQVGTVRIWDVTTGTELASFEAGRPDGTGAFHNTVAWSPDGERIAIGSRAGPVEIWDRVGWRRLHTIEAAVADFGWSHDGRYLAVGGESWAPVVRILDTLTGRFKQTLTGHTGGVHIAGWTEDGRRIATFAQDGVRMWNAKTGEEFFSLRDAKAMAWSHDRKRIATISAGTVRIYDASIGYKLATDPAIRRQAAQTLSSEASRLAENGHCQEASQKLETALSFAPQDAAVQQRAAWLLTTFSDERFRDADRALQLARKLTEASPESVSAWQVLGWAHYRKGNWQASINTLDRSVALQEGGDPWQWFFLAMAHWQLGHEEEARSWFDRSVAWLKENNNAQEEGARFRAEAAKLIGRDLDEKEGS